MVAELVIDLYPRNWLDLLPRAAVFTTTPGDRPLVTALARRQMQQGELVTDLRHRSVTSPTPLPASCCPFLTAKWIARR